MTEDLVKRLREKAFRTETYELVNAAADRIETLEAELVRTFKHMMRDADRIEKLEAARDGVYTERNRLVAFIASIYPSGVKKTAIPGWDEAWHGCVYIDLPTGQASWHFHDSEAYFFAHLPSYQGEWDGHSTEEKYERIARKALEGKDD